MTTQGQSKKSITFYDIASLPPLRTFAPNPFKTRLALNLKQVSYSTSWTEFDQVTTTRKALGAPANRKHGDGSDFYTLPVIVDHAHNDAVVGDTLEIAVYLDATYPDSGPRLIREGTVGITAAFNSWVDSIFTDCVMLCSHGMPLDVDVAAPIFIERAKAAGAPEGITWEMMGAVGQEARGELFKKLKAGLAALVRAYELNAGVFLEGGDDPSYSDVIVAAWLAMYQETIGREEWDDLCSWHGGIWGRLNDAMARYAEIK